MCHLSFQWVVVTHLPKPGSTPHFGIFECVQWQDVFSFLLLKRDFLFCAPEGFSCVYMYSPCDLLELKLYRGGNCRVGPEN